jgi:hypothetical protein
VPCTAVAPASPSARVSSRAVSADPALCTRNFSDRWDNDIPLQRARATSWRPRPDFELIRAGAGLGSRAG